MSEARLARERPLCGARCMSEARLARERPLCGARCLLEARLARERHVCGARCQCSAGVFSTSASGRVCRPAPIASLSSAGNSEPSGRARYSGREINSSLPRPDELPFKKISSHNSWSPTKSSSCWTGDIFFCAACSVPPVLRLHPRPKEQFFLFPPPKATFPAPSASPTHFRVSK